MRGYSQAELARICGISQSAISNYERGERVKSAHVFDLAKALEINIYWLNSGIGEMLTNTYQLSESRTPWPFPNIEPADFWALTPKAREIIENTVIVLIQQLTED